MVKLLNTDCMDFMSTVPDKYFQLAICDPPYGSEGIERTGGTWANAIDGGKRIKEWDFKPNKKYFDELFRVSENQIIWGGNFFGLPANRHYLIWKKHMPENFTVGMCEYAWSSLNANPKVFEFPSNNQPLRFHPSQKPVQLYKWLLKNYAKPEYKIIDTHLGSGSSAIAAYDFGIAEFVGCEIDTEYFEAALKRFEIHKMQKVLF
jgi:site-specific DNA-methyltransferase (adenine-specific)